MTNAQVEAVALEALVSGTPQAQIETVALETLVTGTPQAQVETVAIEVLAPATTSPTWSVALGSLPVTVAVGGVEVVPSLG